MTFTPRTLLMISISAIIVCGLLALLKRVTEITPQGSLVAALYPPYVHDGGMAWRAERMLQFDEKVLLPYADDPKVEGGISPVIVYEDAKPLGPAHSNFAEISKVGNGRFNYWIGQGLIFSTSDGSDPNRNGRRYWAVVP